MRAGLMGEGMAWYVDATGRELLGEARTQFSDYGLEYRNIVPNGSETVVFTWRGDRVNDTMSVWFKHLGQIAQNSGAAVRVFACESDTVAALQRMASDPPPDPAVLADCVRNKLSEKYDWLLDEPLMNAEYASRKLDVSGAHEFVETLVKGHQTM